MSDQLFRKAALDKLASPERLDVLMQVTSPKGWVALWTVGVVLAAVVAWSIFGSVPTRVEGEGILLRGGSLREIKAEGEGVVTAITIRVADTVKAGQVIADIEQQDVEAQVNQMRVKYEQSSRELDAANAEDDATMAQTRMTIAGYRADIQRMAADVARLEADLTQKRELLKKGLITKARVDAQEQQVLSLRVSQTQLRATIANLEANLRAVEQRKRARTSSLDMTRLDYERATQSAASVMHAMSTVEGRVVELRKRPGDRVAAGESIAVIEPPSAMLEPLVYVSSSVGKRIRPGMEAQIAPSTVKKEEYGFMKATIRTVGDYPVTPQAVRAAVANDALVQELLGTSAKLEVWAALQADAVTPSGYAWSSSSGPPYKVDGGTRITVSVVVDRRAPISYVLPLLRGTFGLS